MTILDRLDARTARARARTEGRMRTEFALMVVPDGEPEWIVVDGIEEPNLALIGFSKGRLKATRTYGNLNQDIGGTTATTVTRELHLPVTAPHLPEGAFVEVISIDSTSDPTLLGARMRIAGPVPGDQSTARRLEVTERVG